jgi:hypothetical protein
MFQVAPPLEVTNGSLCQRLNETNDLRKGDPENESVENRRRAEEEVVVTYDLGQEETKITPSCVQPLRQSFFHHYACACIPPIPS